jgi:hypothetical protein
MPYQKQCKNSNLNRERTKSHRQEKGLIISWIYLSKFWIRFEQKKVSILLAWNWNLAIYCKIWSNFFFELKNDGISNYIHERKRCQIQRASDWFWEKRYFHIIIEKKEITNWVLVHYSSRWNFCQENGIFI